MSGLAEMANTVSAGVETCKEGATGALHKHSRRFRSAIYNVPKETQLVGRFLVESLDKRHLIGPNAPAGQIWLFASDWLDAVSSKL